MSVAALYDIHGNLPALEAVLRDVEAAGASLVVIGGDVVPGPMAEEALALLSGLDIPTRCLRGNGEREVLAQLAGNASATLPEPVRDAMRWVGEGMRPAFRRWIGSWPATFDLEIPGLGRVLFCHATPASDTAIITRLTSAEQLRATLADCDASLVVCGHTHMQFDRTVGATRVVNAGSVGMPFGAPGAYWLLLGPDVQLRHTAYDLSAAADRLAATAYPGARDFVARHVLRPPSEEEMLAAFGGAEPAA